MWFLTYAIMFNKAKIENGNTDDDIAGNSNKQNIRVN